MSEYAILRVKKLKSEMAILGSLRHTFREQPTPNADPTLLASNTLMGATSTASAMLEFRKRLPDKVRKNAVLALEYLITASPEAMAQKDRVTQDYYFRDALEWLREKHGEENVFCTAIHRDETSPHLICYVLPKDEKGKLNCRHFLGERNALRALQTDFADRVGKYHQLRRGIEGSKAKHQTVSSFYSTIQNTAPQTASKTLLGNIRPEAYEKVKSALEAYQARDKAIKHREQVLDRKIQEVDIALSEADKLKQDVLAYRQSISKVEADRDRYKQRLGALQEEYRSMDQARLEAIGLVEKYRSMFEANRRDMDA